MCACVRVVSLYTNFVGGAFADGKRQTIGEKTTTRGLFLRKTASRSRLRMKQFLLSIAVKIALNMQPTCTAQLGKGGSVLSGEREREKKRGGGGGQREKEEHTGVHEGEEKKMKNECRALARGHTTFHFREGL